MPGGLADRLGDLAEAAQVLDDREGVAHRRDADLAGLAERLERRDAGLRERAERLHHLVEVGRDVAEVGEHRRRLVRQRAEADHRRLELAQEGRQALDVGLEVVTALGGGLRHLARLVDEGGDVAALARERRERGVGVTREVGQDLVLRGEQREDLVDLLERRVGAADDLVELGAAAGDAGAELREDQRQPLPVRQAHDVVDQVEVDRLRGVADRQQVLALALALVDLLQRRRRGGVDGALLGRRALDELLADQRLRADLAARVGAEVLVAGVVDARAPRPP